METINLKINGIAVTAPGVPLSWRQQDWHISRFLLCVS